MFNSSRASRRGDGNGNREAVSQFPASSRQQNFYGLLGNQKLTTELPMQTKEEVHWLLSP